ncbi:hypothetical protein C8Q80DRAFT_1147814 [Daedaleopsis nitida]|nr:hypothetical protein C8Q80DRAFT_1147814 [Daedaleopsis nitida]
MAKRTQVPTAFHAELTEYSSMLRALRTSNTLDLTAHLTKPPSSARSQYSDEVSLAGDLDDTNTPPPTEPGSHYVSSEAHSSPHSQQNSPTHDRSRDKGKQRDTWTRWPLLAGDVHVPEWELADEVKHLAERVLAQTQGQASLVCVKDEAEEHTTIASSSMSASSPDDEDDNIALPSATLQALTADSAAFLTRILALLAAHVPQAEKSMQNRVRPICWETVVDVACAHGVISTSVAKTVHERMSQIYPPTQPNIIPRIDVLHSMNEGLRKSLVKHDDDLLAIQTPALTLEKPKVLKRKRGPYKKRGTSNQAIAGASTRRRRSEDG